ncbi:MAG: HlyC/CorC family transporter [Planctomycetes bacterium]|nr:HlyC/CorC family transporter [Planctomycetota bacterium]
MNSIALRTFSFGRLQEAFKAATRRNNVDERVNRLVSGSEKLILCSILYRVICEFCLFLALIWVFDGVFMSTVRVYIWTFATGSVLYLIFGIAIPHAWAKYAGEKLISRTYGLLRVLSVGAAPVIFVQKGYDGLIRRLAGVAETTPEAMQEEKHEDFLSELEQHRLEGAVDEEEQEMIENVLELSDSTADEIMTPRTDMTAVEVNTDLKTILDTIATAGHTRVPVYEDRIDNIVGLVYAKDLLAEIGKDPGSFMLREHIRKAYFVPETKPLRALLHEFQAQKLHIAVVLDEYGGTAGIVTLEDILEELVGEIADEYEETPEETLVRLDDHTIELDARTYVDDLNDEFELGLPEDEDYDTVGGFVFTQLGYIPKSGEVFEYQNLTFTIVSAEARSIKRLKIQRDPSRVLD